MSAVETRPPPASPRGEPVRGQDRRLRIAQVIPSFRLGGTESVMVQLLHRFDDRVEHLVLTPGASGPLAERFPRRVHAVALGDDHRPDRWNAVRMARVFRRFRPDIVHTRNWTCIDAVVGARLAGVPVVIHGEHGREATDPDGHDSGRRRIRRWLAPMVTRFVAVSRDLARWLVEDVGVPARKVTQIYNGVDTSRFAPGDRQQARAAARLPGEPVLVGIVGRLDPVKDHVGLIGAFARVARGRRVGLVIVGDGPSRPELESHILAAGLADQAWCLGERDDVPTILRALDCFVLSSVGEGISNAILEAMATGLPLVATRVGGNGELVDDGVTGTLVPARAPGALAAALERYADSPALRRAHGEAGRARVLANFSLDAMLAGYHALYERVGVSARS